MKQAVNRAQRRQQEAERKREQARQQFRDDQREFMPEAYFRAKVEAMERLQRNGITAEDLKRNYDLGYKEGFKAASVPTVKSCFAAVCLALSDLHGYGAKRCMAVLNRMDEYMLNSLTSMEAIAEVYERMGLELDPDEPFDRVQEVKK